jgi:predicted esterase
VLNASISLDGLTVLRDVAYRPGARGMMDVYRPTNATGRLPVLVFFYGGSWQSGNRGDYRFVAATLARRGMVVVVPDYRLYPEVQFPAFIDDAAQAVRETGRLATEWGGDPSRIVLAGHSAGAYLAAMLALAPDYLGEARAHIAGMIGLAGPYDFLPITGPDIKLVFGASVASPATQPISFADATAPPMLLLHGGQDIVVRPGNSTRLAAAITRAGGDARVEQFDSLGHIGIASAIAPLFQFRAPVVDRIVGFVASLPPR